MTFIGKYVNQKTINYITKYVTKIDIKHKGYKPKILCSKGLGKGYLTRHDSKINRFNNEQTIETYRTPTGTKLNLPTYYRNKLYTDEQREKLWINLLDKNERYVCGEKIKIDETEEEYYKLVDYYRLKNNRLGYGDDSENWSIKMYKKQRKNLKKIQAQKKKDSKLRNQNP